MTVIRCIACDFILGSSIVLEETTLTCSGSCGIYKMAASPNTSAATLTPKKKDESFLDKIGTLARKKKAKEGLQF